MMEDQLLEEVDDVEDVELLMVRVDTINQKGEFSDKTRWKLSR